MVPVPCSLPAWIACSRGEWLHFPCSLLVTPSLGALESWEGRGMKQPLWSSRSLWAGKARDTTVSCAKEGASWRGKPEPNCPREQAGLAAALGSTSTVKDAKKLSSLHPQESSLPLSLYQGSRMSCYHFLKDRLSERTDPSAPRHM